MTGTQSTTDEEKLKHRYRKTSKIFSLLAIIYALWIAILILGTYFLALGNNWAIISLDTWILTSIALFSIFIGLELLFLFHLSMTTRKYTQKEQPQKLYLKGKRVYNFTLPFDAKGGIFSKTYIMIDEGNVLSLRYQMIPPNDLWAKKQ